MDGKNGIFKNGTNQVATTASASAPSGNNTSDHHTSVKSGPSSINYYDDFCLPSPKRCELYGRNRRISGSQTVCCSLFERKPEDLIIAHAILDLSTSLAISNNLIPSQLVKTSPQTHHLKLNTTTNAQQQTLSPPLQPFHTQQSLHSSSKHPLPLSTLITNGNVAAFDMDGPSTPKIQIQEEKKELGESTFARIRAEYMLPVNGSIPPFRSSFLNGGNEGNSTATSLPSHSVNTAISAKYLPVATSSNNAKTEYSYETLFFSDVGSEIKPNNSSIAKINASSSPNKDILRPVLDFDCSTETRKPKIRYICSECGKNYTTSSNLSRHKQTHNSLDSQAAQNCPTCGKVYVSRAAFSMHIRTHNLHLKCNVCQKAFSRTWLLQGHMRSHTGEKPYSCAQCGKAFADRSNRRAHMQTHSSSKEHTCIRCNKSFALKSYLKRHYAWEMLQGRHVIISQTRFCSADYVS